MNNEKFIEEFNKKNEMFVRDLTSKESFVLSWHAGAVLPISHPKYYNGRINVEIRKIYNNSFGNINFEKDEYQVSNEIVNKLSSYVENNIEKLVKLALNQTTEMYEGVSDNLSIKFKSIYISLSRLNATSEEEASKHGKIIETIEENDEYWLFKAGFEDGHADFDDGVGSIYISKADGSTRGLNLWDMDFTRKFKESAKVIYNYSENK